MKMGWGRRVTLGSALAAAWSCGHQTPPPVPPPPPPVEVCEDPAASNRGAPLPCRYDPSPPAPLPPPPTRAQALAIRTSGMQGMTFRSAEFGDLPWFEGAFSSLNAGDRQALYAAKHAEGDTHCLVALSWDYREPGQPYGTGNRVPGRDMTGDLPGFRALVEEIIRAGFIPVVFLAGDGVVYSQAGGTYGYDWLYRNMERIIGAVAVWGPGPDLSPYIVWIPGWDGVF